MRNELTKQSIIGAIQRTRDFCCPRCGKVLDVFRAVELDAYVTEPEAREQLASVAVLCGVCFDKMDDLSRVEKVLADRLGGATVRIEALDGRKLRGAR